MLVTRYGWLVVLGACCLVGVSGYAGNLLPGDSGYEAGLGYFRLPWGDSPAVMELADSDDAEGRQCAVFTVPPGANASFSGPELRLKADTTYTLSFLAKAGCDGLAAAVTLVNTNWQQTESFPVTLLPQWRRCEVTFHTRFEPYWLIFEVTNNHKEPAEIRFDACQLEEGSSASTFSAEPGLRTGLIDAGRTSGVFFPGEPVYFRVLAADTRTETPEPLNLVLTVTDYRGRMVAERREPVIWNGKRFQDRVAWDDVSGFGLFTVRAAWCDTAGKTVATDVATFAVIPQPLVRHSGKAPFGGINGALPPGGERIGSGWVEHCVTWINLEPEPGRFQFEFLDSMREMKARGAYTKLSLIHQPSTPVWARDPADADEAAKAGLNPGKNLLPAADKLAEFTRMWTELMRAADGCIDIVELGGEDDLIIGNDTFYRRKYADQVGDGGFVCGDVSTRLGQMTRAAIAGIRAADPKVKIAVNRVSGEDCYQRDFQFTRGVLAELGGDFDYFSMDAYCRRLRYIDTENTWIGLPDWDLSEVFGHARKLTGELGRSQPPFISEYGFAIDLNLPPDHRLQLEMAKRVARTLILARALETPCFFWFSAQQLIEAGKYDYGMWRYGRPTMTVPAYAMAAQAVENVERVRLNERYDNVRCAWFDQGDRAVMSFWNIVGDGKLRMALPDGVQYLDMMGNALEIPTDGVFASSDLPQYLVLTGPEAGARLLRTFESVENLSFPLRSSLKLKSLTDCGITVSNPTGYRGATECRYTLDRGPAQVASHQFEPESGWFVPLPSPVQWRNLSCTLRCVADGNEHGWDWTVTLKAWPTEDNICTLADRRDIYPPDPHIRWSGPADLSVELNGGYDAESLTLDILVWDDRHFNHRRGAEIWNGDALQLAFHPGPTTGGGGDGHGYGASDAELIVALTAEGAQAAVTAGTTLPVPVAGRDFTVERDEAAGTTRYRVKLSRRALHLEEAGAIFSFSFVVFDDDDGEGQSYYCQLSGGITGAKNPDAFPLFYLK